MLLVKMDHPRAVKTHTDDCSNEKLQGGLAGTIRSGR